MPRVTDSMTRSVFFLFRDGEGGEAEDKPVGTGFFVGFPKRYGSYGSYSHSVYAVTNAHVLMAASTIRVNSRVERPRLINTNRHEWIKSKTEDLVILDVSDLIDVKGDDCSEVNAFEMIWRDDPLGRGRVGDQTIMVGMFSDHSGGASINWPVARFGRIASPPSQDLPVKLMPTDIYNRPAYLNDMQSRGGFSGSPVWAWYNPYEDIDNFEWNRSFGQFRNKDASICLIGIHRGQFREIVDAVDYMNIPGNVTNLSIPSTMSFVIPAWNIMDLLNGTEANVIRDARSAYWSSIDVPDPWDLP